LINFVFNNFLIEISTSVLLVKKERKVGCRGRNQKKGEWIDGRKEGKKANKKDRHLRIVSLSQ
jgi:hypothetical protein